MTAARRSPSVATATAAVLRGAAPPKKLRPRAGLGTHVAIIAMAGAAGDAPVPQRHPRLGTVPPPVPRLPARTALSPGGAPGKKEAGAGICGPGGDSVKQKAVPSLLRARSGCQCPRSGLPAASSPYVLTEGDTEYIHYSLMKENTARSRVVQCPPELQKLQSHSLGHH